MKSWPMVPLREVLAKSENWITIDPDKKYKEVTVRLWGNGVTLRREVFGAEIASTTRLQVHPNQFIISRIDARNGASGLIPNHLEGAVVSNDFPVFNPSPNRLDSRFFGWFSKTKNFEELCKAASEGTTNRIRLKEDRFLAMEIALPPVNEQQRLVERIDALAAKIDEAKKLRRLANVESGFLTKAALDDVFDQMSVRGHWPRVPLRDAASIARGKFTHRPRNEPRFYGGRFPFIQIGDISDSRLYIRRFSQTLNEDGLRISRMFPRGTVVIAITGATVGVTGILDFDSCFPDSIVGIQPIPGVATSEFIYWAVEYEKHKALSQATQTTQPNINLKNVNSLTVPLPSIDEQKRLIGHISQVNGNADLLGNCQLEVQAALDAMLPAILDRAFRGEL